MGMIRLLVITLLTLWSVLAQAPSRCTNIRTRREIRQLSRQERMRFFRAIHQLNHGDIPTVWDNYALWHLNLNHTIHRSPFFLPFHRRYLVDLEKSLQAIDPSVTLPYWDWSLDAEAPFDNVVFSGAIDWLGSQGICLNDGAFARFYVTCTESGLRPHCLSRRFRAVNGRTTLYGRDIIQRIIDTTDTYNAFRELLEYGPHNLVHDMVGGDMDTMCAPNDPVFFLHHAFVDKLWADWQRYPNRGRQFEGTPSGQRLTSESLIPYYNEPVSSSLSTRAYCYQYAPSPDSAGLVPSSNHPSLPGAISNDFIDHWGYNATKVRNIENYLKELADKNGKDTASLQESGPTHPLSF
ncbi:hypothetical protein IWQ61_005713 [Dispira simplex]|nr:hypothetical protein IWQ61_005713 [Dispira simplex]